MRSGAASAIASGARGAATARRASRVSARPPSRITCRWRAGLRALAVPAGCGEEPRERLGEEHRLARGRGRRGARARRRRAARQCGGTAHHPREAAPQHRDVPGAGAAARPRDPPAGGTARSASAAPRVARSTARSLAPPGCSGRRRSRGRARRQRRRARPRSRRGGGPHEGVTAQHGEIEREPDVRADLVEEHVLGRGARFSPPAGHREGDVMAPERPRDEKARPGREVDGRRTGDAHVGGEPRAGLVGIVAEQLLVEELLEPALVGEPSRHGASGPASVARFAEAALARSGVERGRAGRPPRSAPDRARPFFSSTSPGRRGDGHRAAADPELSEQLASTCCSTSGCSWRKALPARALADPLAAEAEPGAALLDDVHRIRDRAGRPRG